jgi:hypothetical protein
MSRRDISVYDMRADKTRTTGNNDLHSPPEWPVVRRHSARYFSMPGAKAQV